MELEKAYLSNALSINTDPYWTDCSSKDFYAVDPAEEESLQKDQWSFGYFWEEVVKQFSTVGQLYLALQDLHQMIQEVKETFRRATASYPEWKVEQNKSRGVNGSYFLVDEGGQKRFVIKPLDEEAGCIHSESFTTPFTESPLRKNIPLYLSSMREVLAYRIAQCIGAYSIVPKTEFGIFTSDQFHHFSKGIDSNEWQRYVEYCGPEDQEKLCSVQEYVPNAKGLFEAVHEFQAAHLSDEEISHRFDQKDFEDANILLWTTYDTDGHLGNFLVYPKGVDEIGNEILGLKKIDNGLAFPDKNRGLRNNLSYLPNAKLELSETGRKKITAIDADVLAKELEQVGLYTASHAMRERISALQELAQKPGITLKEINQAMRKMGKDQ